MKVEYEVAPAFEQLLEPARFKGTYGGRGSGKSWFWAGETVDALLSGKNVLCIREVQNSIADSVKRLIEARIDEFGLNEYFEITEKEIRCPASGAIAIFRGMQNHTAASVKSLEGFDVAWWEEAQTASQRSLDLLLPTIRAAGSELWFSWNPENSDDPIDVFLRKEPPDNSTILEVNYYDNPWFPEELRADMERDKQRDPDKYAHIWGGQYKSLSEARVFRNWRVGEIHPRHDAIWFYGMDWGFANDATAGVRCCFSGENTLFIRNEIYEIGTPTERLPDLIDGLPDARKWPMAADSARPETIDYVARHGYPKIHGAKKGKGSIEDGVSFIQGLDVVIHDSCVNTIHEFKNFAYRTDKQTGKILPIIEDANNHCIDALRYALERAHSKGKIIIKTMDDPKRRNDYGGWDDEEENSNWKVV